jgi:hypothetical protein
MHVQVCTTAAAFQDLRSEWLALLARLPFQSIFFTPQWQETWWRHFGAAHQLHLLTVRSDDGQLQGLAPLMSEPGTGSPSRLELIGDLELCDYLDVLIAPEQPREVGRALGQYLVSAMGEETELLLTNLAPRSLTPTALRDSLVEYGLAVEVDEIETCPAMPLPAEWDAYLATLRGKDRHEMRRKLRRAADAATLTYEVTRDAATLDQDLVLPMGQHTPSTMLVIIQTTPTSALGLSSLPIVSVAP